MPVNWKPMWLWILQWDCATLVITSWTTYCLTNTPFRTVMSRNRYQLLSTFGTSVTTKVKLIEANLDTIHCWRFSLYLIVDPLYTNQCYTRQKPVYWQKHRQVQWSCILQTIPTFQTHKVGSERIRSVWSQNWLSLETHHIHIVTSTFPADIFMPFSTQIVTSLLDEYHDQFKKRSYCTSWQVLHKPRFISATGEGFWFLTSIGVCQVLFYLKSWSKQGQEV